MTDGPHGGGRTLAAMIAAEVQHGLTLEPDLFQDLGCAFVAAAVAVHVCADNSAANEAMQAEIRARFGTGTDVLADPETLALVEKLLTVFGNRALEEGGASAVTTP